ncbi:hypothetical protein DFJ77DRAFT_473151 [Powellomyces hirtus]|nr:hypothetical protein DFJ77DRAFT_473151 [Powellomyces hirtus]
MRTYPRTDGRNPIYSPPPSANGGDGVWYGGGGRLPPLITNNNNNLPPSPPPPSEPPDMYYPPVLYDNRNEASLQDFRQRLAENERAQQQLARETAALQGSVRDAFRYHEDMSRDEAQLRRVFEDHFQFFNTVVQNMQAQMGAMGQQLTLEREAAFRSIEFARQHATEQAQFADGLRNELRNAMRDTDALRSRLEGLGTSTAEGFAKCVGKCDQLEQALQMQMEGVNKGVGDFAANVKDTMQSADEGVKKEIQAVQEHLKEETQAAVKEAQTQMTAAQEQHRLEIVESRQKEQHLLNILQQQHDTITDLNHRLDYMDAGFRDALAGALAQQASARETELAEMLKAIQATHAVIKSSREDERDHRAALQREMQTLRRETGTLRQDLEEKISQMIKPFVIL